MQTVLHFILLICYTGNAENIDVQTAIMAALAIALFLLLNCKRRGSLTKLFSLYSCCSLCSVVLIALSLYFFRSVSFTVSSYESFLIFQPINPSTVIPTGIPTTGIKQPTAVPIAMPIKISCRFFCSLFHSRETVWDTVMSHHC